MGACFIVPPDLLLQVARTGEPQDREAALATLALDSSIRAARVHNAALAGAPGLRGPLYSIGGEPRRTIFDARHTQDTEATDVLRNEGEAPVPDQSADQAHDALGTTYRFYWEVFQRDSIDSAGMGSWAKSTTRGITTTPSGMAGG